MRIIPETPTEALEITFTEEEILADLFYPEAPGETAPGELVG